MPQRTCVGCKQIDEVQSLFRFVLRPDTRALVPDLGRKMPGRGALLHPRYRCASLAVKKKSFAKAFGAPVNVSTNELQDMMSTVLENKLQGLFGASRAKRHLVFGKTACSSACSDGTAKLLILARDARSPQTWESLASEHKVRMIRTDTKAQLGERFGRGETATVVVTHGQIGEQIEATLGVLSLLAEEA